MEKTIKTPVLFISFARLELARLAFAAIKKAKPEVLYFYSNAPNKQNPDEINNNKIIRDFVNEVDWECDLQIFFRLEPVDVYNSLFSAIDWVFEQNERAIIIEEDCLCSYSFFFFCEELLEKYQKDNRVWMISGNNYHDTEKYSGHTFFFSRYMHIYGWATWKNRWQKLDRTASKWEQIKREKLLLDYFYIEKQARFHHKRFDNFIMNISHRPAWDVLFYLSMIENRSYAIVPRINLVQNLGKYGIHSRGGDYSHKVIAKELDKPISYPIYIIPNSIFDKRHFSKHWLRNSKFVIRYFNKVRYKFNSLRKK